MQNVLERKWQFVFSHRKTVSIARSLLNNILLQRKLSYKLEQHGIKLVVANESYTSKASLMVTKCQKNMIKRLNLFIVANVAYTKVKMELNADFY